MLHEDVLSPFRGRCFDKIPGTSDGTVARLRYDENYRIDCKVRVILFYLLRILLQSPLLQMSSILVCVEIIKLDVGY